GLGAADDGGAPLSAREIILAARRRRGAGGGCLRGGGDRGGLLGGRSGGWGGDRLGDHCGRRRGGAGGRRNLCRWFRRQGERVLAPAWHRESEPDGPGASDGHEAQLPATSAPACLFLARAHGQELARI